MGSGAYVVRFFQKLSVHPCTGNHPRMKPKSHWNTMMYTRKLTDIAVVQMIMMVRSVKLPRTYATMIAKTTASEVVRISTGIMIVSVGPRRVSRMRDTSSLVDQLRPKSKVKTCFTNTISWYQ